MHEPAITAQDAFLSNTNFVRKTYFGQNWQNSAHFYLVSVIPVGMRCLVDVPHPTPTVHRNEFPSIVGYGDSPLNCSSMHVVQVLHTYVHEDAVQK
jgi:hypothetical protein